MSNSTARFLTALLALTLLGPTVFSQVVYFPKLTLESRPDMDNFVTGYYSAQLKALEEPSLFELAKIPAAQSYRFLWLRSFDHPIAVRLDIKADGTGVLTTKMTSQKGGVEPGTLIENNTKPVTAEQTQAFLKKIEQVQFWSLTAETHDPTEPPGLNQNIADGADWIIEGVHAGKYHVVKRWSPETGPIRELGIALVFELAEMNIPKNEVY